MHYQWQSDRPASHHYEMTLASISIGFFLGGLSIGVATCKNPIPDRPVRMRGKRERARRTKRERAHYSCEIPFSLRYNSAHTRTQTPSMTTVK